MSHQLLRRATMLGAAVLAAAVIVLPAGAAGVSSETADVVGQGPAGPVVSAEGATLQRSDNGISVKLTMPTPAPGSYAYPGANAFLPAAVPGHPEAFSLWVFVFNYPTLCSAPCDSNDLGVDKPAMGGAFNAAGHIAGGPMLNFSGHLSKNTAPLQGTPFTSAMLLEPRTAEIHLAVAPHGAVRPDLLPDQITKPIGATMHWWLAIFD